jgi:hypothetical protein
MLENEDSVVTSLNELRKLKHERITRQTQSRAVVGAGRAAALAVDPASDQMTPPPATVHSLMQSQRAAFPQASAGSNAGFGATGLNAGGFAAAPASYVQPPPIIQTKTSVKAAVFVAVVLIGAGGAGYVKLQTDTQAVLAAKDASIKKAEESRSLAAESAAKSEMQSRNSLRQCEDKLKAAMAMVPAVPAASSPSTPALEQKQDKPAVAKVAARPSRNKPAARPARRTASAEPATPKSEAVPNIAKKKKLDNDPLAGLNKL